MSEQISKRGRPATGQALTPAQRQQASRAKRLAQEHESFPARQVSILLSPQATQALDMLSTNFDMSQKTVIEKLLVQAYADFKANL